MAEAAASASARPANRWADFCIETNCLGTSTTSPVSSRSMRTSVRANRAVSGWTIPSERKLDERQKAAARACAPTGNFDTFRELDGGCREHGGFFSDSSRAGQGQDT